ncbi:MAG: DUF642 domain-containing protein [Limisphaerales bacterium]
MNARSPFVGSWLLIVVPMALFAQGTFQNGTFDSPGLRSDQPLLTLFPAGNTFITGWTTVSGYDGTYTGSVEYLVDRSQNPTAYWVEVGYYFGVNAIEQTFSTTPNQPYLVSFSLATDPLNGPPALLRVSAAGTSADYQAPPRSGSLKAMGWQRQSFVFTSDKSGSTTLWFGSLTGVAAIDTIAVTAVPEPRTCAMFALGALAIILSAKHRRRGPWPTQLGSSAQTR